jgi:hypothetical protein
MGSKLPPDQLALYKRIDEILFYKWDPIGVSDMDWSRDEYQSYLPRVFSMALAHEAPEKIAEYLTAISTENMCLNSQPEHDLNIAKLVLSVKDKCLN